MAEVKEAPKTTNGNAKAQGMNIARSTPAPAPAAVQGTPFEFMRRFAEEMDRLFGDFGLGAGWHLPRALTRGRELLRRETGMIPADWSPQVDIQYRDGKLVVRADLPGMSKDDIKVEIKEDMLAIQGERKQEKKEEHEGYFYNECSYGSFYRAIPLPEGADAAKATAEFKNGVLEVAMPAPPGPQQKVRRLEVREPK
jgi:HSP20 family protein